MIALSVWCPVIIVGVFITTVTLRRRGAPPRPTRHATVVVLTLPCCRPRVASTKTHRGRLGGISPVIEDDADIADDAVTTPVAVGTVSPDSPTSEASDPTLTETFRPDVTQELGKPEVCRPIGSPVGLPLPFPCAGLVLTVSAKGEGTHHAPSLLPGLASLRTPLTASLFLTLARRLILRWRTRRRSRSKSQHRSGR